MPRKIRKRFAHQEWVQILEGGGIKVCHQTNVDILPMTCGNEAVDHVPRNATAEGMFSMDRTDRLKSVAEKLGQNKGNANGIYIYICM